MASYIGKVDRECDACGQIAANHPDCSQKNENSVLKACGVCQAVFYGNTACQKSDWKNHKPLCNRVKVLLKVPEDEFQTKLDKLVFALSSEGHQAYAIQVFTCHARRGGPGSTEQVRHCFDRASLGDDSVRRVLNPADPGMQASMTLISILQERFPLDKNRVSVKDAEAKILKTIEEVKDLPLSRDVVLLAIAECVNYQHPNWFQAFSKVVSGDELIQVMKDIKSLAEDDLKEDLLLLEKFGEKK